MKVIQTERTNSNSCAYWPFYMKGQDTETVEVPLTPFSIGFNNASIDPLADSTEYGIDLYVQLLEANNIIV